MNQPTGLYTWEQILAAAAKANQTVGRIMPQAWIDCLNEALRELPSRPEPLAALREAIQFVQLERDCLYEGCTNQEGEYIDPDDEDLVREMDEVLARLRAAAGVKAHE